MNINNIDIKAFIIEDMEVGIVVKSIAFNMKGKFNIHEDNY